MTKEQLIAGTMSNKDFEALLHAFPAPPNEQRLMLLERQPHEVIPLTQSERERLLYFAPFDAAFDTTPYTSGRVFHKLGELRWERHYVPSFPEESETPATPTTPATLTTLDDTDRTDEPLTSHISLIYTGDSAYSPKLDEYQDKDLDRYGKVSKDYFLFGKRFNLQQPSEVASTAQQSEFAEVRIPRLLLYPALKELAGAERLKLVVCEYTDSDTGNCIAYRFQELIRFEQSQAIQEPQEELEELEEPEESQELDEDESL